MRGVQFEISFLAWLLSMSCIKIDILIPGKKKTWPSKYMTTLKFLENVAELLHVLFSEREK